MLETLSHKPGVDTIYNKWREIKSVYSSTKDLNLN